MIHPELDLGTTLHAGRVPLQAFHPPKALAVEAPEAGRDPERQRAQLRHAVGRLIQRYRGTTARQERRGEDRIDFIQSVQVWSEDGREFTLLSHDLSATGIRLIASRSLLGQKLFVMLPSGDRGETSCLLVRVVWTSAVGDELYENGGMFLELVPAGPGRLRVIRADGEADALPRCPPVAPGRVRSRCNPPSNL